MTTRRQFLHSASLATAAAVFGPRLLAAMGPDGFDPRWFAEPGTTAFDEQELRVLASRALDAARSAGAQYADVRFTLTRIQTCSGAVHELEHIAIGVRALVNNVWGFVASPAWTPDEAVRLGTQAAKQAALNSWGIGTPMDWGSPPPTASGTWSTPVKRDPFTVSVEEKMDLLNGFASYVSRKRDASVLYTAEFMRQDRAFASSEGAFCTQTIHTTLSGYSTFLVSVKHPETQRTVRRNIEMFTPTSGGYEILTEAPMLDLIDMAYDEALSAGNPKTVDLGRFDVVFDAHATAGLVSETIGQALEIDRARGYEANAGGTSYLAPIADILGKRQLGTSMLSVRADRSSPHGAATVRWDDDGLIPQEFDLVKEGRVVDYETSREHVSVAADFYKAEGQSAVSRGCSAAANAMNVPVVTVPNLTMAPSNTSTSFDDLVAGTTDGYAVVSGQTDMDHQKLTGQGTGALVYRVKQGKIVHAVGDLAFLFRSPEIWKSLSAIGGAASTKTKGFNAKKGQPEQWYQYSVSAVPAKISNISVVRIRTGRDG